MTQTELFTLLVSLINSGLAGQSVMGVEVLQSYQPVAQGAALGPAVYISTVSEKRYGHPQKVNVWDEGAGAMTARQAQYLESVFQVNARVLSDDPENPPPLNSRDLAQLVADILQSDIVIAALNAQNVGVLRITDVREPYVSNDRDRFDLSPSFDVNLTSLRIFETAAPAITAWEAQLTRV